MRCFKATVEYDGTDFAGFQWQRTTRTVQGALEDAIHRRTRLIGRLTGAGRTDAGVHALGQVISFQAETNIPLERMAVALNSALPADVSVRQVEEVEGTFNARFSASSRQYLYLILNCRTPSALLRRYSAFCAEPLDVEAMRAAAQCLRGERNFAAFTNELQPGQTTQREVIRCQVGRHRSLTLIRIEANAFLRGMVRVLVGTLIEIGSGKRAPEDMRALLLSGDRRQAGFTAPPQGLCLLRVRYGERKDYTRPLRAAETSGGQETTEEHYENNDPGENNHLGAG